MNLQYLRSFYVTVKSNSISKAAKILFLTQPGLSMQLQALEKELDSQLLIRSNKGVELTKQGQIVFNYADKILALKDNIARELDAVKADREELIISSCKSIGEYALPCSLYIYKSDHPLIDIDLRVCSSTEVIKDLTELSSHIGITQTISCHPNLSFSPFYTSDLVLVGGNQLSKTSITLKEFLDLPLILPTEGSGGRQEVLTMLSKQGIDLSSLNIVFEANSLESIKSAVIAGKGFGFFPTFAIQKELTYKMLIPIQVEDYTFLSQFYICYRNDYALSSFEKEFIDLLSSSSKGFC